MRHNRGNILILFILLCLGLFFQNQRSEGFLKMFKNTNFSVEAKAMHSLPDAAESWPGDQFLLVYDRKNGESLRLAFNIEKTLQQIKKDVKIIPVEAIAQEKLNYAGNVIKLGKQKDKETTEKTARLGKTSRAVFSSYF